MKSKKMMLASSLAIMIALGGVGLGVEHANAVDPGWATGQDIGHTTDRDNENAGSESSNHALSNPVSNNDDDNEANTTVNNQNQNNQINNDGNQFAGDNGYRPPVIGGGKAGDLPDNSKSVVGSDNGNNNNNQSPADNDNSNNNPGSSSPTDNDNSNNSDHHQPNANSQSSKPADSTSHNNDNSNNHPSDNSHSHKHRDIEPTLSRSKLIKIANKRYKEQKRILKNRNQMRVMINNQKGAPQLRKSYLLALNKVKNHELTKKDAAGYVSQQKDILQRALSQRLATLQSEYDQNEKLVRDQVNALPDGHQYDKRAIALDDAMHNLDYQLGDKSNRAYDQYNRSVNQLMAQTQNVQDAEKKQFLNEAKTNYENNLAGSDAEDPVALKHDNQKREKQLKKAYQNVLEGINNGSIKYRRSVKNAIQAQ